MRPRLVVLTFFLMLAVAMWPENQPEQYSDLTVTVLKAETGKPIRNAAVVLRALDQRGKAARAGVELKTDAEGQAKFRGAPYGKLRIQVIARGLQTFGEDFDINQPAQEFIIRLKPPQQQYSIYK